MPKARPTTDVNTFLAHGCGRCEHFRTPQCKVHLWTPILAAVRPLLLATELEETMKWGSPTYTVNGTNTVMLGVTRTACHVSFLRGALLDDPDGLLVAPGPNTQSARMLALTSPEQVDAHREALIGFVNQAISFVHEGRKVVFDEAPEPMPDELQELLDARPDVQEAFEGLTPGRKRSYVLHVGGAKQSATRARRADKCVPKILAGKGFHDR